MTGLIDTGLGFKFEYCLSGKAYPLVQKLKFKDSETLTKGDLVNLESGEVDLAATNDAALLGAVLETKAGTDSTTEIEVIVDVDAVYSVYDPNVRLAGATLDIAGATGAMTVAASSNADLIVVAPSTAAERTFVRITPAEHAYA
jgi:hypothetical protein